MYRVLLVEDDVALRFIYSKMKTWSDCGFTIAAQAPDGGQALEILKKESFDLIFTDIRMPFVDGIELLRRLKEQGSVVPVVFASSYNEFEYARQGLVLGAFDYLLKPVKDPELAAVLNRVREHIDTMHNSRKINPTVVNLLDELGVSAAEDPFVHQIAVYCSAHMADDLSGDVLAESQGYNKDYFGKVFKQHFRISYREFSSRMKIAQAIELLRTGNYKAYEISDKLGYRSVDYFSKVFKDVTGMTLAEFKSGMGGKKQ